MPVYKHEASGERLTFSPDATPEEVRLEMSKFDEDYIRKQKEAGQARVKARSMDPMGDPTLGAVTQPGQQAAAERAEAFGANQGMDALEEFMGSQGAQTGVGAYKGMGQGEIVPPGGSQGPPTPTEEPYPTLSELMPEAFGPVTPAEREAGLAAVGPAAGGGMIGSTLGMRLGAKLSPKLFTRGARVAAPGIIGGAVGEAAGAAGAGEDPVEAAGRGGLYGLLGETVGGIASKAVPKLLAPFRSKVLPEAMAAANVLEPLGARLTPAQMTNSRMLDVMENVAKGGLFGGASVSQQRAHAIEVAQDLVQRYRLDFPEKGGQVIQDLYRQSDKATRGITVDLTDAYQQAVALAKKAEGRSPAIVKLKNWVNKLGKEVEVPEEGLMPGLELFGAPPTKIKRVFQEVPFAEARELRSDLLAVSRQIPGEMASGKAHGAARKIVESVHDAMDAAAQGAGPRAHGAWRLADETYKQAKFGNFVEGLTKKGMDAEGNISGKAILTTLNRTPKERLAIFSPANVEDLREFAQVLELTQRKDAEGLGKVWIQLIQGGIATGAFAKGMSPEAALVLAGPRILSWAITNPKTAKWLTVGFAKPGTKESTRAIGMLIGQMSGRASAGGVQEAEAGELYNLLGVTP